MYFPLQDTIFSQPPSKLNYLQILITDFPILILKYIPLLGGDCGQKCCSIFMCSALVQPWHCLGLGRPQYKNDPASFSFKRSWFVKTFTGKGNFPQNSLGRFAVSKLLWKKLREWKISAGCKACSKTYQTQKLPLTLRTLYWIIEVIINDLRIVWERHLLC